MRAPAILLALLAVGCDQNAILELQVQVPAAPDGDPRAWYAQIQVRNADGHPFSTVEGRPLPWMGGSDSMVTLGDEPLWECISVISNDETLDVHVRVRFCRSENCGNLEDSNPPERLYSLEHPFYLGRRTYHRIVVPGNPDCTSTADCTEDAVGVCIDERCSCATDTDCGAGYRCEPASGCVEEVGRCSIEGCIEGDSSEFCSMETGLHFCERNDNIPRDNTYRCDLPE